MGTDFKNNKQNLSKWGIKSKTNNGNEGKFKIVNKIFNTNLTRKYKKLLFFLAWFYLSIIIIISIGTFLTSVILSIHGRRQYNKMPPIYIRFWFFVRLKKLLMMRVPPQLSLLWTELNVRHYFDISYF